MTAPAMRRNYRIVLLVFLTFFVMSFLTNILGPLVPDIISSFHVSLTSAALLPFSFFIAYGVLSVPAGIFVERFREKPVMLGAFSMGLLGALSFALAPHYGVAVASLFLMGGGMAVLQVAINPLLRAAGGEEHFAFNSTLAQLVFGSASFLSPRLYSYLVVHLQNRAAPRSGIMALFARVTPPNLPWVSIYWVFAAAALSMLVVISLSSIPRVERTAEERVGSFGMYRALLHNPVVLLYFGCVFAYVGSEQGTADWISRFLSQYHGYDPHTAGAMAVSWFWGLLTVGCAIGMALLKFFDSRRVLRWFAAAALISLTVALFGSSRASLIAFPAMGLCASVMWPILSSLAFNSVAEYHGSLSGILCTGIMGGAVVPLVIGRIGDSFGLRAGMMFLYLTLGCVLSVSFWARPLITNATIGNKEESLQRTG